MKDAPLSDAVVRMYERAGEHAGIPSPDIAVSIGPIVSDDEGPMPILKLSKAERNAYAP